LFAGNSFSIRPGNKLPGYSHKVPTGLNGMNRQIINRRILSRRDI